MSPADWKTVISEANASGAAYGGAEFASKPLSQQLRSILRPDARTHIDLTHVEDVIWK
jgi:hypothetical protein